MAKAPKKESGSKGITGGKLKGAGAKPGSVARKGSQR